MKVHILASCRNTALLDNTMLVLDTIRVGFPTAEIALYGNGLEKPVEYLVRQACAQAGFSFEQLPERSHGQWIEALLDTQDEPFWICDTDIIFHKKVEDWFQPESDVLFAGRYEPEYREPWTKSLHAARLHPSLMWFNTPQVRASIRGWPGKHEFFHWVDRPLIRWSFIPFRDDLIFLDTCAGLHGALVGTRFTDEQNTAFSHLFCGTYLDVIQGLAGLEVAHQAMKAGQISPALLLASQQQWYRDHAGYKWDLY